MVKATKTKTDKKKSPAEILNDKALDAAKTAIAATMDLADNQSILSLLEISVYVPFKQEEEFIEVTKKVKSGKKSDEKKFDLCITAIPQEKGKWGTFDEDHLDAFKEKNSGYPAFFRYCVATRMEENLMYYTACRELESLESDPSAYFELFDEIYDTFVRDYTDARPNLQANLIAAMRINFENVMTTYRDADVARISRMDAAMLDARRALYDTIFNVFRGDDVYKKSDMKVDMYDPSPNSPDSNLDFWLHEEEEGFKKFMKFAKKQDKELDKDLKKKEKLHACVNLLDFYTACRGYWADDTQPAFNAICETYLKIGSDKYVAEVGELLRGEILFQYALYTGGMARARR